MGSTCRLVVFGGGNMGGALVGGLVARGWAAPGELHVVDLYEPTRAALLERVPGLIVTAVAPKAAPAALIAVKPNDVVGLGATLRTLGVRRVLSVAAGVTTAVIEAVVGDGVAVVRAMPNTPALVGQSASAVAAGRWATTDDLDWACEILDAVGTTVRVTEPQLDAVTGLSGSGPAYLFLVAESLIEAGVLMGLTRPVAETLTKQLFVGSAALMVGSDASMAQLRANVTSPGGTTAAGLRELERCGVRSAVLEAVNAATERSRALGNLATSPRS